MTPQGTNTDETQTGTPSWPRPTGLRQDWTAEFIGQVFVVQTAPDDEMVVVGGENGIGAVSPSTGERVWTTYTAWIGRLPAISATTVYAAGRNGTLHALARSDGSTQWTFEGETGLTTAPLVFPDRDRVVVGAGQSNGRQVGSVGDSEFDPTYLYVLNTDGSCVWSVETAGGNPVTATAVHDDRLYLRTVNRIEAYSLTDGTRAWRLGVNDLQWDNVSLTPYRGKRMFADENGVYVPTKDGVAAFAPDGTKQWRFEPFDRPRRYQYESGMLYVGAADNAVYAIDTTDGSQTWRTQLDGEINVLVRGDDGLWTGTETGTVGLLLPDSGETRFTKSIDESVTAGDVIKERLVIATAGLEFRGFAFQYP
ncbi:PQQ-binding-like beta-propeller repeat protein [Halosimplex pelagicum]|uniref:PQQ-binding-like beta-propeller repeat protein n=1 Tax=Halosimplex pelagicum TaxID=869886 RepID=A0A7D5TTG5_9EURY|nr:PQQ-binding-like beta-propeller repeat protein [Halosimplex pelagicum]QLH81374.1 PQQ-binding-like beta-propeller repeat protein [Halosimplex pelagicum]